MAVSSSSQFSTPEEKIEERARRILAQAVKPNDMDGRRREVTYEAFRTVEDISDISYAFYKEAGWCIPIFLSLSSNTALT